MLKVLAAVIVAFSFFGMLTLALAQESSPQAPKSSPSPVIYSLPFPGILPDHPLFFVKVLRDKILLILISNQVKRVDFLILLADKYLKMSMMLLDKNKEDLAAKTLADGVGYLSQAEVEIFKISNSNTSEVRSLKDRFEGSLAKEQEVVEGIINRTDLNSVDQFNRLFTQLKTLADDYNLKK
ncbi:MAG: hypothetical protein UV61_C0001G0067 [Candidatus Gottesmanbacteria bacterium GW2011_GWB1_43_11]|uniref:DUF5667 domain-containing protein n=1 Tax=Candidatus Gottesmanbacteria bacterium GW2011_GWB1_43_11 TaxID=1618446 RepID=A0A0G1CPM5_9BACT|nr:MAG: hypothetical protein UV04_C0004G0009 [Candidatus Gottesmanbacteria bacterium GW2011_GWA2_42_16]KKS56032.1 MAG: hypothetical protein UV17_C0003G0004 [Candidatus Gottesmanbacteria bacterium GW2011_GWA1_42_26]KKS81584.1 MAG: hypothetical protein UV55_C0012G0068 [Candidatus Gottesmanbacteria bacterium GW2011_GWC1_43_10]KKS87660.1 MAG: hypothetical protein UV61_C0001G0067 [Candidatus Gottesmanbacteria bacterium GW2011_GWB1_43_11]OGG25331.1 MAG: hypothetical protein A3A59_04740 [Candidatus Go